MFRVRNTRPEDFEAIIALTERVYPGRRPWSVQQLASHLDLFPEGQLVAEHAPDGRIVGMAASLIVLWDDYEPHGSWREFTDAGMFTNHDPEAGRTLYGAEVMVDPDFRRRGIARRIYAARRDLVRELGLARIRAGARLAGYGRHASEMSPEEYVRRVVRGELRDPTLSFQLSEGFHVFGVVEGYLGNDPESLGYSALIEWLNLEVANSDDLARSVRKFE